MNRAGRHSLIICFIRDFTLFIKQNDYKIKIYFTNAHSRYETQVIIIFKYNQVNKISKSYGNLAERIIGKLYSMAYILSFSIEKVYIVACLLSYCRWSIACVTVAFASINSLGVIFYLFTLCAAFF